MGRRRRVAEVTFARAHCGVFILQTLLHSLHPTTTEQDHCKADEFHYAWFTSAVYWQIMRSTIMLHWAAIAILSRPLAYTFNSTDIGVEIKTFFVPTIQRHLSPQWLCHNCYHRLWHTLKDHSEGVCSPHCLLWYFSCPTFQSSEKCVSHFSI